MLWCWRRSLILAQSFSELDQLCFFPVHLLPQHPVGVLKAQNPQPQLVLTDTTGVPRLFGSKIIFSSSLPILFIFSPQVLPHVLPSVPGHDVGGGGHGVVVCLGLGEDWIKCGARVAAQIIVPFTVGAQTGP